nr:ABC transporter substrate-binding protein [Desulfosporosinus sp. FKA]
MLNDPLACYPTFLRVADAAQKSGLLVGCSSNSYFTESSLAEISPLIDFINVGVKGFSPQAYQECGGSTVDPVLRNIAKLYESGVHVEVSCVLRNNNMEEIADLTAYIANISPDIPFQLMRYIPLEGADTSLEPSIRASEAFYQRLKDKLHYVYLFNSPGTDYLNTFCPGCGEVIFKRDFYGPMGSKLFLSESSPIGKTCPHCSKEMPIKAPPAEKKYQEGDFEGGYPFTRALEMMEAILITLGVTDVKKVVQVWEIVLGQKGLPKLHRDIQNISSYLEIIRYFGRLIGMEEQASRLVAYMEEKVCSIQQSLPPSEKRPRVYYIMGKPLFCLMGERFENQLVEAAGGVSANKEIACSGRPGSLISATELNALNPEVIFVSAFLSSSAEDVYAECCRAGVNIEAVKNKRIYTYPAAGWDFGSPRWILGLMYMANMLHPEIYHFDVQAEAGWFYSQFYGMDFSPEEVNRSFSKPSNRWQWQKG